MEGRMLRTSTLSEGYNVFLGSGDSVERALADVLGQVKEAEQDFIVTPSSFSWKGGENRNEKDTVHAAQVAMLVRRTPDEMPVVEPAKKAPAKSAKAGK
jgi:hypothetical protein